MSTGGVGLGTVVLTGATSGIGRATARRLMSLCDHLIVQGPEPAQRAATVLDDLRGSGTARLDHLSVDFTSLAAVADAAERIRALTTRIDVLVNNAGVAGAPQRALTADGFERALQVNALAPALLTRLLEPLLADGARVVNVASAGHRTETFDFSDPDLSRGYTPFRAYARAKLAMVTWSSLLAAEFGSATVVALCPGANDTPLSAELVGRVSTPPTVGAGRVLHAITADVPSGSYLENDRVVPASEESRDPANRNALVALYRERLARFVVA